MVAAAIRCSVEVVMRKLNPELQMGNVFIRPNELTQKGDMVEGHKHNFDHVMLVLRGSVRIHALVSKIGVPVGEVVERDITMGEPPVLIRAGVEHEITALEDDTLFYCIYAHRTPQGQVVQHFTGWEKAYV